MKYTFKTWFIGFFYSATKPILREKGVSKKNPNRIKAECKAITVRAMSQRDLMSSYIMGIYFIAMNRHSVLYAEENYTVIETATKNSKLFKKGMGTAEDHLDDKKMPERLKWAEESHKLRNENDKLLLFVIAFSAVIRCKIFYRFFSGTKIACFIGSPIIFKALYPFAVDHTSYVHVDTVFYFFTLPRMEVMTSFRYYRF